MKKLFRILIGLMIATVWFAAPVMAKDPFCNRNHRWTGTQKFKDIEVRGLATFTGGISGINTTSEEFYVDSAVGADTLGNSYGKSWSKPFATVDYAIGQCTANAGDIINVIAGHALDITAADGFDADVAGIKIRGYGNGTDAPEFTFSDTDATIAVGAANVTFENLRFVAGISAVVIGVAIEAGGDNFTMDGCIFPKPTTNSFEFVDAIDCADGANNITIINCEYYNDEGGAAADHFIDAGNGTAGPEKLQVIGCIIKGDFAVSAIWSDEPCDEAYIVGNTIINHTSNQHCVEFTDAGTGVIAYNTFYTDAEATTLDPGSMSCVENYVTTAVDKSAMLIPVVDDGYSHPNYLAVATGTFDTTGTWSTATSHEIATVTGCVRMLIIPECTATVVSASDTGTIELGDETTLDSIIATSTCGSGAMATGELWVDSTLTRTILTRTQLNALEIVVCNGKDIGYDVNTNALTGGAMTFHIYWTPMDSTGNVAAGAGGAL